MVSIYFFIFSDISYFAHLRTLFSNKTKEGCSSALATLCFHVAWLRVRCVLTRLWQEAGLSAWRWWVWMYFNHQQIEAPSSHVRFVPELETLGLTQNRRETECRTATTEGPRRKGTGSALTSLCLLLLLEESGTGAGAPGHPFTTSVVSRESCWHPSEQLLQVTEEPGRLAVKVTPLGGRWPSTGTETLG